MDERCAGQHDDCPWCETIVAAHRADYELVFNTDKLNPLPRITTVAQAKALAETLLERCKGAAEQIHIIAPPAQSG